MSVPSHNLKKGKKKFILCIALYLNDLILFIAATVKKNQNKEILLTSIHSFIFMAPSLIILFRVKEVTDSVCEYCISSMNKWLQVI